MINSRIPRNERKPPKAIFRRCLGVRGDMDVFSSLMIF